MARIQHVEKAKYTESNKVGQYSKYLDKSPIRVTYHHISKSLNRTDVDTESKLDSGNSVRFDKILDFPLYNILKLK